MTSTTQIRCPFCNAAQTPNNTGNYTCDYCLQAYSVGQAQREESRLLEEIKGWLQQKIGVAASSTGVDAASRSFIFQSKMLPELRRDVDRSLEPVASYAQYPLVQLPIRPSSTGGASNPLLTYRKQVLGLKGLRARLASEQVSGFAASAADTNMVQAMDRRLAEVMFLSNVAEAAATQGLKGYEAARRNLEAVLAELEDSLSREVSAEAPAARYLTAAQERYRALASLCRVCEEACGTQATVGESLVSRLDDIGRSLANAAHAIEASGFAPAETMPAVIGVQAEIASCAVFVRWLRSYDAIASRSGLPFTTFATEMDGLTGGGKTSADAQVGLAEAWGHLARARRGETAGMVVDDFSWAPAWAEASRARKSLGLFGIEEQLGGLEPFLLPVWVGTLTYSAATGTVFRGGIESQATLLVDATTSQATGVVMLSDGGNPILRALEAPRVAGAHQVALPLTTATNALRAFQEAVRSMPQVLNPRIQVRGLALMAAVGASYTSSKGGRTAVTCLQGAVTTGGDGSQQRYALQLGNALASRFG